jgi:lipopolysaccharide export system protein LptC
MQEVDRYSRLVATAKVALPLAALAILSTLFLVAERIDTEAAIPYATVDVRELARQQRIGQPRHAGVTRDGSAITVAAARALPDGASLDSLRAEEMVAQIDMPDGTIIGVSAPIGQLDTVGDLAELAGGVVVTTSTGWRLDTASLVAALDATRLLADTTITATGPLGDLTAGRMEVTQGDPAATGGGDPAAQGPVMLFTGGVRLLYDPGR